MTGAAHDDLLTRRSTKKKKPQVRGGACGPEARKVAGQLMDPQRRMPLVGVKELQRLGEAPPVRLAERGERLEER